MIVLVGKSPTTLGRDHAHSNLGVLVGPKRKYDAHKAASLNLPWAADNDCFNDGFDPDAYVEMLKRSRGAAGCLFVAAPDVVGDSDATLDLFDEWYTTVAGFGFPVALVLQDGMISDDIRWIEVDAVFVGGTTVWKLSDEAHALVEVAKAQGKWVHMGRVNTRRRFKLAKSWGCDSVDGTSASRFTDTHLPWQLEHAAGATQLMIRRNQ